jgi:preprotein translocase subunit SecB
MEKKEGQLQAPPVEIENYAVDRLTLESNSAFDESKPMESSLGLSHSLQQHVSDPLRFRVTMDIVVREATERAPGEDGEPNWPYRIHLRIMGYFAFAEGTPEEVVSQMLPTNGLVMLYGVARGVVAQVTAVSHWGKFVLPSVNFVEYLREEEAKQAPGQSDAETGG